MRKLLVLAACLAVLPAASFANEANKSNYNEHEATRQERQANAKDEQAQAVADCIAREKANGTASNAAAKKCNDNVQKTQFKQEKKNNESR